MEMNGLSRFIKAQEVDYDIALNEIRSGRKRSHWMWYIFPQIEGLGFSSTSQYYAIHSIKEAKEYLEDAVLGMRLREISEELLKLENNNAREVFGTPDDMKLRSSMTLFKIASPQDTVFQDVLDKFFDGKEDSRTVEILQSKI